MLEWHSNKGTLCDYELVIRRFVEFKVLKLTVNCLHLISFESRIR